MRTAFNMALAAVALAALLMLGATPGQAQVRDSVVIQVFGDPDAIVFDGPTQGYVGDTLTIAFGIVDVDGNPTPGLATWAISAGATILEETDSTVTVVLDVPGEHVLSVDVRRDPEENSRPRPTP